MFYIHTDIFSSCSRISWELKRSLGFRFFGFTNISRWSRLWLDSRQTYISLSFLDPDVFKCLSLVVFTTTTPNYNPFLTKSILKTNSHHQHFLVVTVPKFVSSHTKQILGDSTLTKKQSPEFAYLFLRQRLCNDL